MTDQQHRAAPEQWALVEYWESTAPTAVDSCILELRDRIAALEVQNKEDANCWAMVRSSMHAFRERLEALEVSAGIGQPVTPANTSAPADSLVERVAFAIAGDADGPINWKPEARAAIREVAAWLDTKGQHGCSLWLREEANK
jgi:hypothetical protein